VRYSMTLVRPLAAFALALGLFAPTTPAFAAGGVDTKIYAGSGCHVDQRANDPTSVRATTSILENNWNKAVTVTCPIVRDEENKGIEFADLHVLGDVECTIYSRTPQNFVTATFVRDANFTGFPPNGKRFTFFDAFPGQFGFVPAGDSLALNCVMQPKSAIIQYRIDEQQ
jgi:hypothetical protein